jgi:MerR family transcriptional regulator, aldehyde-responsive regulator
LAFHLIRCAINERIGLLPTVTRTESGIHDYSELDIQRVEFTKHMRAAGMPIEGLIDYMELIQQGNVTIEARKEILVEQRNLLASRIAGMQKTLDLLNHKIEIYEKNILARKKKLPR